MGPHITGDLRGSNKDAMIWGGISIAILIGFTVAMEISERRMRIESVLNQNIRSHVEAAPGTTPRQIIKASVEAPQNNTVGR